MSFTWKNGRWLSTTTLSDDTKITYRYNANEMRSQKKVGSKVTEFINKYGIKKGDLLYFDGNGDGIYTHASIISSIIKVKGKK